ncbi:MAG TPA: glutamate--cysteine ligase [Streptosporangiaceae bacterium]|nr:glutamate--cysteine ligase [Streptosporangiaceae bacterium]
MMVQPAAGRPTSFDPSSRLMGVEEEYLVVDPGTRAVVPCAAAVLEPAAAQLGEFAAAEITKFQVEAKTPPCADLSELAEQLRRMRSIMGAAAAGLGLGIIASGTAVLGDVVPPPINEHPRYELGIQTYRALHDEQSVCAGHVHVHLPDRERALLVSNHVRPWLPVLIALMANSPFWMGRDTGYASWRTLTWGKWPVAGPPPYFESTADFDRLIEALTETGVLVDPGTIFWDVRPSARLPTLEVRVTDVPGTAEESALLAALVRALVVVALADVERGDPGPRLSAELLRAAYWRAARDGVTGHGIDPGTGRLVATGDLVDALVARVRDGLEEFGDLDAVTAWLARLRADGGGAGRQRAVLSRHGRFDAVVDFLLEQTVSGALGTP